MKPETSEYLPETEEHQPKKVFQLAPVEEDLNVRAPQLRTQVRRDHALTAGAKVLYDHLSDYTFLSRVSPARGIVEMTKPRLASELGITSRTILRQARELETKRYVWTKTFWFAGFEMTRWYLRGLADSQQELFQGADPRFSKVNGHRARTVRATNGQFCPLEGSTVEMAEKPQKSRLNGHKCPAPTDTNVPRRGTPVSRGEGHLCPAPRDTSVPRRGTSVSGHAGQSCPATRDNPVRHQGTPVSGYKETPETFKESGETFKRLSKRPGGEGQLNERQNERRKENEFMTFCLEVLTKPEMDSNGGMWRTLFRQNGGKAWRVLREVQAVLKERPAEIRRSRGAYAMDLWRRFSD